MGEEARQERWMLRLAVLVLYSAVLGTVTACTVPPLMHRGGIMVASWAEVKADDRTVAGILAAFNAAEAALQAGDLQKLMELYSEQYSYHGLSKPELGKIWEDLLAHHRDFKSNHIFSRIVAGGGTPLSAEVTCTGSLWAVSKENGELVNIDSWYGEVHNLVYEEGRWRILGHRGNKPQTQVFGVAPHPFF